MPIDGQPSTNRYGVLGSGLSKLVGGEILSDMTAPTLEIEGSSALQNYKQIQWVVICPSWCTSYDLVLWRWVAVYAAPPSREIVTSGWVEESTTSVASTKNGIVYQFVDGQKVICQVTNIVGAPDPADPIRLIATGVDRA
jgi:hypothetical protein